MKPGRRSQLAVTIAVGMSLAVAERLHASSPPVGAGLLPERFSIQTKLDEPVQSGVCMREGAKVAGKQPVRVSRTVPQPKKVRDVRPQYPKQPANTGGRGRWIGEVLIDESGTVSRVWVIREPEFTPPFPAFAAAIRDAVRQWEFEPLLIRGEPTPACMTVTVLINWQ